MLKEAKECDMKKIAVCLNLEKKSFDQLKQLKDIINLEGKQIEFLYAWNDEYYPFPGGMVVPFYPNKEQASEIQSKLEKELQHIAENFADENKCEAVSKVFKSNSPKRSIVQYFKEAEIDLAVCLVEKRDMAEEFFHSSFCHYLQLHSQRHILCLNN